MKKTKNKKKLLVDKIFLGLNIIATISLLLSYLASSTDPLDASFIALLGFGYFILVIINIAFLIYWVIRKRVFALISLFSILVGFKAITANFGFHDEKMKPTKPDEDDIRVLQYNVRTFEGIDKYDGLPIQNEILDLIGKVNPDIVNMEEFSQTVKNDFSFIEKLKKKLNLRYAYYHPFGNTSTMNFGNCIFSRYPIIDSGLVSSVNVLNTKAIFADIKIKDKKVRIYNIHLAPVSIQKQEKGRLLKGKGGVSSSTFIIDKVSAAFVTRSHQVQQIKRHIKDCPYPIILTGDFNDTPMSFSVNEVGDGLQNAFIEKGGGLQTTFYTSYPLQIDYIFVSPNFEILNYTAINKKISDHKPIISDIRFK